MCAYYTYEQRPRAVNWVVEERDVKEGWWTRDTKDGKWKSETRALTIYSYTCKHRMFTANQSNYQKWGLGCIST